MKTQLSLIRFFIVVGLSISCQAQTTLFNQGIDGGAFLIPLNDATHPCISEFEYQLLDQEVHENLSRLSLAVHSKNIESTTFIWPLQAATGFNQCNFHFIGAYVDQNTAATAIQDFNCETNTYDGHQGTDIAIWPYGFYKMDNSQVEVIAAAAGTIVQRADGNFDRNCATNSLTANSIIIQHADGSQALYWHMKKNSVTTKTVGQTVVAGEYLGVVGSSGSSTGPHLHFEVRSGSTSATYKDPFSGSCNLLNANSWWVAQKPHTDPAIMKVSVNTTDIAMASCPTSDVPTESDTFLVPFQGVGLAAGYAKFYIFLREIPASTNIAMRILNPNGTVYSSWNYTITTFYKTSYWGFSKVLPTTDGVYTFEANYNGVICSRNFTITHVLGELNPTFEKSITLYPNPVSEAFTLQAEGLANGEYVVVLSNALGQIVREERLDVTTHQIQKTYPLDDVRTGIYYLTLSHSGSKTTRLIVKN
jgi:murein DD-endopeptidase MepM/ murein hydrolase activator NlpD